MISDPTAAYGQVIRAAADAELAQARLQAAGETAGARFAVLIQQGTQTLERFGIVLAAGPPRVPEWVEQQAAHVAGERLTRRWLGQVAPFLVPAVAP